jgi:hypothetical protein
MAGAAFFLYSSNFLRASEPAIPVRRLFFIPVFHYIQQIKEKTWYPGMNHGSVYDKITTIFYYVLYE